MPFVTTYAPPRITNTPQYQEPPRTVGNIANEAFWRLERQLLQQEFTDITMEIILAGGAAGVDAMPRGLDVLVDWDVFNTQALDWMRNYFSLDPRYMGDLGGGAYAWANQLTDTTRKTVIKEIDSWVREGAELAVLEKRLAPTFGEERAALVASTEVTRTFASGNLMMFKSNPIITGKRFLASADDRMCPVCGALHNTIVGIEEDWNFTPDMLAVNPQLAKILAKNTRFTIPPLHPRCRCYIQPVLMELLEPDELANELFSNVSRRYVEQRRR